MNSGPNWQWPQWPIAHFILRSIETKISGIGEAGVFKRKRGCADHHLRPADHRDSLRRIETELGQQGRDIADVSRPLRPGALHRDAQLEVGRSPPFFNFAAKNEIVRRARAIKDADAPVSGAMT